MSKLRAAVIGLGMMGRNHARVLTSLEGVDLVAVADPANSAQDAIIGPVSSVPLTTCWRPRSITR